MGEWISSQISQLEMVWNSEELYLNNGHCMKDDEAQQDMRKIHDELAYILGDDSPPPPPLIYEETPHFTVASNLPISSTRQLSPPNCNHVDLLQQQEPNVLEIQRSDDSDESNKKSRRRKRTREPDQALYHVISERNRRQLTAQLFISLAAVLPSLKKMDKTTILGEAINHMKQLKETIEALEEAAAKEKVESRVMVKRSKMVVDNNDDDSSDIVEDVYVLGGGSINNSLPEIEATVSHKTLILKLYCGKQKGILAKIYGEIEKHDIIILHCTVAPLGNSLYNHTFVGQIKKMDKMRMKDLIESLNSILHAQ